MKKTIYDEFDKVTERLKEEVGYDIVNDIYHDGFEDGIKFFLRHLYVGPVNSIDIREWGETLNRFRRWKSADEWSELIEGEV